jgi:hypothetical protein
MEDCRYRRTSTVRVKLFRPASVALGIWLVVAGGILVIAGFQAHAKQRGPSTQRTSGPPG